VKLGWNANQQALAERYEHLARAHIAPAVAKHYESGQLDRWAWQRVADDGLWRLAVPENLGGYGLTWWDFTAALEGIVRGSGDLGFCLSLIAHAGFLRSMLLFGGPYHLEVVLPQLLGGAVGATALTEPRGGSDVARANTTGHPVDTGYKLVGLKAHITNAPQADLFWLLGRVQGLPAKRDLTVFVVDRHSDGVETGAAERMLGNRTSPTGPVAFNGVLIGADQVLGAPGDGLRLTYATIMFDRLLYGVIGAAYLERLLRESMDFAASRTAFGQPIAEYQYIQRRITNIKLGIETSRWVSYAALASLLADDPDAALMSSTSKLVGSEALAAAAIDVMQVHGHQGYEDGWQSRSVRDALGTLIAGGTSDIQRKNIFTQLLKLRGQASDRGRDGRSLPFAA
jgi:alkylation response protein AidB-like acyl-CoA dehydrogenase